MVLLASFGVIVPLKGWSSRVWILTTISSRKAPSGFFVVKIDFLIGLLGPLEPWLAAVQYESWDMPTKSPSSFINPASDMSSFLSLPFPTIGELTCLFFDIYFLCSWKFTNKLLVLFWHLLMRLSLSNFGPYIDKQCCKVIILKFLHEQQHKVSFLHFSFFNLNQANPLGGLQSRKSIFFLLFSTLEVIGMKFWQGVFSILLRRSPAHW